MQNLCNKVLFSVNMQLMYWSTLMGSFQSDLFHLAFACCAHIKVTYMVNTKLGFMDWFLYYLILSNLYKTTALGTFQKWSSYETPLQNRLKQITFCHCTNFRLHEDVCCARSCTQKSCTHVVVVYWSKNISKNAPSPGCIQNADKNQPSMSYAGHRYI